MNWVYLSPHLDDVALSCGGLVWEQTHAGDLVSIWTICAGDPPLEQFSLYVESLHARWNTGREAARQRRGEDRLSCPRLGADFRHFPIPDCIYRRSPIDSTALYTSDQALFGEMHPSEVGLAKRIRKDLGRALPPDCQVVCPLTLGGHVDHRLVRAAAEGLGRRLWYYADYPYVVQLEQSLRVQVEGFAELLFPVSEQGLEAWWQSVAAHASQISTFWPDLSSMQVAIREYYQQAGGVRLWLQTTEAL